MRNWNGNKTDIRSISFKYPAYLWGIETAGRCTVHSTFGGIQPTYEELKHKSSPGLLQCRIGIQPTYEELKQVQDSGNFFSYLCIQPTYEELKPCNLDNHTLGGIYVSSLPMRNWNPSTSGWLSTEYVVSSLPMRNWNACRGPINPPGRSVSSLPMRNWNPPLMLRSLPSAFWYPAYLWGIETAILMRFSTGRSGIQPTYEELKHKVCRKLSFSSIQVSSLPMRNWNL